MPVNYIEISKQISEIGIKAEKFYKELNEKKTTAVKLLEKYSDQKDFLQDLVKQVLEKNNKLRCAVPLEEPLTAHIKAVQTDEPFSILAADGSQIYPSQHDSIPFGLINTGAFYICPKSNSRPIEHIQSQLLSYEDVFTDQGLLSESNISLIRDYHERNYLAELAKMYQQNSLITLTDGPLELYHEQLETRTFRDYFAKFLLALEELRMRNSIVAGYIDKPYSDLLVRLLELTLLKKEDYEKVGSRKFFTGTMDRHLFENLLQPGERSTIFKIQSLSSEKLNSDLVPHFFFFKPQNATKNTLARIEIPAWIAYQPEKINLLHYALNEQCQYLGNKAYPYCLHRAHEIALVKLHEKTDIKDRIIREHIRNNLPIGESSQKDQVKNVSSK